MILTTPENKKKIEVIWSSTFEPGTCGTFPGKFNPSVSGFFGEKLTSLGCNDIVLNGFRYMFKKVPIQIVFLFQYVYPSDHKILVQTLFNQQC